MNRTEREGKEMILIDCFMVQLICVYIYIYILQYIICVHGFINQHSHFFFVVTLCVLHRQVSPEAKVSVKLVANAGIGTIAAGVAKALAGLMVSPFHHGFFLHETWETNGDDVVKHVVMTWHCHVFF